MATPAGFWKRFAAAFIDGIVSGAAIFVIAAPILALMMLSVVSDVEDPDPRALSAVFEGAANLLALAVGWVYFAAMESSPLQGTLGKLALQIRVTDLGGGRIGFGQATGRYFGKFLSALLLFAGFVMAAFTERKQGLHDKLAGCLVVNRQPLPARRGDATASGRS